MARVGPAPGRDPGRDPGGGPGQWGPGQSANRQNKDNLISNRTMCFGLLLGTCSIFESLV